MLQLLRSRQHSNQEIYSIVNLLILYFKSFKKSISKFEGENVA
nr:MAG TPA: hypothetical protein [Caudoviricetes sp.]